MASESAQKLYQLHAKLQQKGIVPQPAQMHSRARAKLSCQVGQKAISGSKKHPALSY